MKDIYPLIKSMEACQQTKTQNILQHGRSVFNHFLALCDFKYQISYPRTTTSWKMPEWAFSDTLWKNAVSFNIIRRYMIFHDCGKPFCITTDEKGNHFENHAEVSYNTFLEYRPNDTITAELIKMDMDIHLMTCEKLESFAKHPLAATLLIAALCELHSNAQMFGGTDSVSFKIKWKKLNKFGKQIVNLIEGK